jgi:hypothetical protein
MSRRYLDVSDALMHRVDALRLLISAETGTKPGQAALISRLILVGLDVVDQQPNAADFFRSLAVAAERKSPRDAAPTKETPAREPKAKSPKRFHPTLGRRNR